MGRASICTANYIDYFETALNYEMTATEALENHFWERKYAGEALA